MGVADHGGLPLLPSWDRFENDACCLRSRRKASTLEGNAPEFLAVRFECNRLHADDEWVSRNYRTVTWRKPSTEPTWRARWRWPSHGSASASKASRCKFRAPRSCRRWAAGYTGTGRSSRFSDLLRPTGVRAGMRTSKTSRAFLAMWVFGDENCVIAASVRHVRPVRAPRMFGDEVWRESTSSQDMPRDTGLTHAHPIAEPWRSGARMTLVLCGRCQPGCRQRLHTCRRRHTRMSTRFARNLTLLFCRLRSSSFFGLLAAGALRCGVLQLRPLGKDPSASGSPPQGRCPTSLLAVLLASNLLVKDGLEPTIRERTLAGHGAV